MAYNFMRKWKGNGKHVNAYYTQTANNVKDRPKGAFGPKDKEAADDRRARIKAAKLKAKRLEKEKN